MHQPRTSKRRRRLPPLNPLRAFEAAARHLSFTRAAEELSVTQGAVSRSVNALEEFLGFALLERSSSGLAIRPANQNFGRALTNAFAQISEAVDDLIDQRSHTLLTVRAYTAFMIHWLIPHLSKFHIQHPEIEVRLISANEQVRLDHDRADVRVRYGHGQWRDKQSVFLFPDEISPVCAPQLLHDGEAADPVAFLQQATFLHCNSRRNDWQDWLAFAGLGDMTPVKELYFEEASVMIEAAAAGLGIAVVQHAYVRDDLRSSRLAAPFVPVLRRDAGYYATYSKSNEVSPAITAFCEWLVELTASSRKDAEALGDQAPAEPAPLSEPPDRAGPTDLLANRDPGRRQRSGMHPA